MQGYLERLIHSQDEPIADWVCIPLYFVSKLARDSGTTVVQVGEGSDEQFCGYPQLHAVSGAVPPLLESLPAPARRHVRRMTAQAIRGAGAPASGRWKCTRISWIARPATASISGAGPRYSGIP